MSYEHTGERDRSYNEGDSQLSDHGSPRGLRRRPDGTDRTYPHQTGGGYSLSDDVRAHLQMEAMARDTPRAPESYESYLPIFGDLSFSVFSVVSQRVLIHPCVVFKNQCQLNRRPDVSYTLFPWTMLVPIHNIYKNQGVLALWKGIQNDFIISLIRKAVEKLISENSSLPQNLDEPNKGSIISTYAKHLLLKTISALVAVPFICAGYTLKVQSQIVVSDANYFSIFSDAYRRVPSFKSETSHMLPLYKLVLPITALSLGTYIISSVCVSTVRRQYQANTLLLQESEHDEIPTIKTLYDKFYPQLLGAMIGNMIADLVCYPLSTVTGRLILQGTRTFIDDPVTGNGVQALSSAYTGPGNCLISIVNEEGWLGLYKGFGALIMQYCVQGLLLRGTHLLYERIMDSNYPRVPRRNIYTGMATTPSSTYSSVSSLNKP